jgi:hypothetical protein
MSQRYVSLNFQASDTILTATAPASPEEAPPGYYMLFILDSLKVPSEASFVRLFQCLAMPGDADADEALGLPDAISIVNYVFSKPGWSSCPSNTNLCWLFDMICRGDWSGEGDVTLADAITCVNYVFSKPGGPWNPVPSGACCLPVP